MLFWQYQSPHKNKLYPTTKWKRHRKPSGTLFCILLIAIALQFATQETAHAQGMTHYIRYGETLSTIAVQYGVTVQEIARANAIYNINNIRAGQSLLIPGRTLPQAVGSQATASQATAPQTVVPQAVAPVVDRSARVNSPVIPQPITPQAVYGCNGVALTGERTYTVRHGDTLYGVGRAFRVSALAVQQRNSLHSTIIRVGQCLIVPASSRTSPAPDNRRDSERQGTAWPIRVAPHSETGPVVM